MANITLNCPRCGSDEAASGAGDRLLVKLARKGAVRVTCSNGHSLALVVQHPKFDVLAEIACQAILDGYPREAVASFQAALERFYEYFFFVLSDVRGIPDAEAESAWKAVSKQSERQLGLYVAAYLFHFGEPPALLSNDMVAFRNRVIHQGDIPEEDEAISFGQAVLDTTYVMLRNFSQKNIGAVTKAVRRELAQQSEFAQPGDINVNAVWRLIYSFNVPGPPTFDLAQEIKERREARELRMLVDAENARKTDQAEAAPSAKGSRLRRLDNPNGS